jgi:hypothetical protein
MLEVHLADDAAVSMRRAVPVTGHPSVEPKNFLSAQGQLRRGRTSHGAKPCDNYVIVAVRNYHG